MAPNPWQYVTLDALTAATECSRENVAETWPRLHVLPVFAADHAPDRRFSHIEAASKSSYSELRMPKSDCRSDLKHLILSQFSPRVIFSAGHVIDMHPRSVAVTGGDSASHNCILAVLGMRSRSKVRRLNARRRSPARTQMANDQPIGDRTAIRQLPSDVVRPPFLPCDLDFLVAVADLAVPKTAGVDQQAAPICVRHKGQAPDYFGALHAAPLVTGLTTEPGKSPSHPRRWRRKLSAALLTGSGDWRLVQRGTLRRHRDLPLVRNRGASPRLLTQVRGLSVARILP